MASASQQPVSATGGAQARRPPARKPEREPSRLGRILWTLLKVTVPILMVAAISLGVLYVRLLNGPISLNPLAAPIVRSIAAELPGVTVDVDDAVVLINESGGIEFRLRNVRFFDSDRAPIATAPLAAVSMSFEALLTGRLAPSRIVLIEPRLLLLYTEDGGLAFSFSRAVEGQDGIAPAADAVAASPAGQTASPQPAPVAMEPSSALQRIDLARTIADLAERVRAKSDAASYLQEFGVRNATVVFDHSGHQTIWRVISAELDLEHKKRFSTAVGNMMFASARGPWGFTFKIEDHGKERLVALNATVRDLVPRTLAGVLPQLAPLEAIDFPVAGDVRLVLTSEGVLQQGTFALDIGRGAIRGAALGNVAFDVESGRIETIFDPASGKIEISNAMIASGGSRIAAGGSLSSGTTPGGSHTWAFDLRSKGSVVAAEDPRHPPVAIDEGLAQGSVDARSGAVSLSRLLIRAGAATLTAAGRLAGPNATPPLQLDGQIGPMPLATAKALWPRVLAPGARAWVMQNVRRGQMQGAALRMTGWPPVGAIGIRGSGKDQRLTFTMEATDIQLHPTAGMSPIEAPRALLRVEGTSLEVTVPDAVAPLPGNRRIALKGVRFTAVDIYGDRTLAEIAFRAQGTLPAVLDYVAQEPIALTKSLNVPLDGVDGKVDGQFKITLPLIKDIPAGDIKVEGKARLTEGRARQLVGSYDVQGASISLDASESSIEAKGEMLVGGIPTRLAWQRFPGQTEDKQPPLRLSATLDASDRAQLGLDVNHIALGEMPVELSVMRGLRGEILPRVRVDLTNAELLLENLSWRKAPGRAATLQFDVGKGAKYKTELQNFKLVGADIAVDGWMGLDQNNRLREFLFPEFSINVVSRLELQGVLRPDNIWDVKARGTTYDGREFFRSLFSIGQLTDKPVPPRKDQPGLDLKADVDNVLGFSDVSIKRLSMRVSKRQGRLTQIIARGALDNGKSIDVGLQPTQNEPRKLVALSDDAGRAFKLVGFYPNLLGGKLRLEVHLDAKGPVEKSGLLFVEQFQILGDPVINEVLKTTSETGENAINTGRRPPSGRQVTRQVFEFDRMRAPFSVGNHQFVLEDADLRGPLVGAILRGKADFRHRNVDLGGTYVPLQGLNAALGAIPGLGQLLAGPRGEGVLGITFAIQGPMANPQVTVNPLSLLTPGLTREMMQMTNPSPSVTPAEEKPAKKGAAVGPRASSVPATARKTDGIGSQPRVDAEGGGGWSSQTTPTKPSAAPASPGSRRAVP